MDVVTKATGTVTPVEDSKSKHGEFDVILSTAALDRDGDELHADEWKTPLPEKINFDSDHGMSVATCVGSGTPFINDRGQLQVRGTFASTPHGQAVRTLVKEGHIDSVSVAFRPLKNQKSGRPCRELLNGAFVAVPANSEAKVLAVKEAKDEPEADAVTVDVAPRLGDTSGLADEIKSLVRDAVRAEMKDVLGGWKPDSMNTVADMFQNDPLDGPQLEEHVRGIHEAATRIREIAVLLGNGMPYSDPDATPDVLAPNNRSFEGAETKSSPQDASTEAPAAAAVPAGTDDDVELLKAKAWADAFLLTEIDED